ncbi:hypothetical protein DFQ28_001977 [Apophysomyces sp. BC1034]|nr:hypothetical protein DFQ30_002381 [Apophysomyces sp. BC1015]KAG0179916.1 hypothetical protein DFQ29_001496 [Apophysomyces sp. BC1021]KAG0190504.1 hypothetical protein DFQ28_001977 [Apophysomyces sp. BC1034]
MEDDELQAIRQKRLAELQAKGQPQSGFSGAPPMAGGSAPSKEDDDKKSARERLARIQMVKADKARAVEDLLIRMAQSNQLRNQVTEKQLVDLLGQINQQEPSASQTRIVYNRRRFDDDSDDEYDL